MDLDRNPSLKVYALTDFPSSSSQASRAVFVNEQLPDLMTHHIDRTLFPETHRVIEGEEEADENLLKEDNRANEDVPSCITFERCTRPRYSDAVFELSAPNSFWLKKTNWAHGPLPSNVQFNYNTKNKCKTKVIRRIIYNQKRVKKALIGRIRYDPIHLNGRTNVTIYKNEMLNEEEILANLPPPPPQEEEEEEQPVQNPDDPLLKIEALKARVASLEASNKELSTAISANDIVLDEMLQSFSLLKAFSSKELRARWEFQKKVIRHLKERNGRALRFCVRPPPSAPSNEAAS